MDCQHMIREADQFIKDPIPGIPIWTLVNPSNPVCGSVIKSQIWLLAVGLCVTHRLCKRDSYFCQLPCPFRKGAQWLIE